MLFKLAIVLLTINLTFCQEEIDFLKDLNDHVAKINNLVDKLNALEMKYELALAANNKSCTYYVANEALNDNNWLLIGQRIGQNHSQFKKTWTDYKNGFGDTDSNYWIGLEKIYELTRSGTRKIRFEFMNYNNLNKLYFYEYSKFKIADETDGYRLSVGALIRSATWQNYKGSEFLESNGKKFTANTNEYCDLSLPVSAGWWMSNSKVKCIPKFCPLCEKITTGFDIENCFWDEARIFIQ